MSRGRRVGRWIELPYRGWLAWIAIALALAGVVAALVVQLAVHDQSPDGTTVALLVVAACLTFALLAPRHGLAALKHLSSFKVAGVVEVGMKEAALAQRVEPPKPENQGRTSDRNGKGYLDVVSRLKTKMRFVYTITDLHRELGDETQYFEIANELATSHLLRQKEWEFVLSLLSEDDPKLDALSDDTRERFLDAAWSFADRFAFTVWDRFVRSELREAGWEIFDRWKGDAPRREFLAYYGSRGWALMTSRVGEPKPYYYGPTRDSLEGEQPGFLVNGRCIVLPGQVDGNPRRATVVEGEKGKDSKVKVLELQGSLREHPEFAFESSSFNQDANR